MMDRSLASAPATRPTLRAAAPPARARVETVDIVRGAVMVLMALDHVRVYSGVPAGGPVPGVFLTRWVTHFCAPAFFFLAGTSAYLRGDGGANGPSLSRWLATRGALLVLLELTFLRLAWTFNFDYAHYSLAGVIWALGWCMVLLSAIVRLPVPAIAGFGLVLVAGHNALPLLVGPAQKTLLDGPFGPLLRVLYFGGGFALEGGSEPNFFVLYSLVPWVGVMALGYACGRVFTWPAEARRRWCVRVGAAAVLLFLVLRAAQTYGDWPWRPGPGEEPWAPAWIMFLATTKYPASFQFLLMTLGPMLLALAALERWAPAAGGSGRLVRWLTVFGRVPLFFYLLHIPLIHLVAVAIAAVRSPAALPWLFTNHPARPADVPSGYTWGLPLLYAVTLAVVCALYWPCRRYLEIKSSRRWGWTSYI
jgi:uncharacterized membrane protein